MRPSAIAVIGAPLDLGAGRRGGRYGPIGGPRCPTSSNACAISVMKSAISAILLWSSPRACRADRSGAKFLPQIASACTSLAELVENSAAQGCFPLVLGGDHSGGRGYSLRHGAALACAGRGTGPDLDRCTHRYEHAAEQPERQCPWHAAGLHHRARPRRLDPDFRFRAESESETCKPWWGIRDVDIMERPIVKRSGVRAFTMRDIDERGMRAVMREAIQIASQDTAGFHVSLDMDALDPLSAPGVGTPVKGGG